MRTIDLALKDIRQVLRDRRSLLFLVVMPILFTFFFGFVYSGQNEEGDPRLPVGVIDRDPQGVLSQTLVEMLASSETVRPVLLDEAAAADLDKKIVNGELAAGLVIPAGFSDGSLRGENPRLEVVNNEETDNGQTVRRALQSYISRSMGLALAARASADAYQAQSPFADDTARRSYLEEAVRLGAQAWQKAPLTIGTAAPAAAETSADPADNPYNQFSPGMMVQFAIFGLIQAAMVTVIERRTGAMARLMTTPMTRAELIAGHILGMFIIFFAQQVLLVAFGQLVLKVDYLRQPLAVLAVMVAISLWVASLGLLISSLVRQEEQVIMGSMAAMFVFSALGGCWFSLEMVGETFATIGHLTPSAWAMDAYQNIIQRGLGFSSVLAPMGVLLAYTLVFFGISVWKFKYE